MNALNLKFTAHSLGSDSHKQSITGPTTEIHSILRINFPYIPMNHIINFSKSKKRTTQLAKLNYSLRLAHY